MLRRRALGLVICLTIGGCRSTAPPAAMPALPPLACPPPATFDQGKTPTAVRHVAKTGDDRSGDGSAERPYQSIQRALQEIGPGTAVRVHPGTYEGEVTLSRVQGTAEAPIWITGVPGEKRPTITAGNQGIYMVQPRYVVLEHLEIAYTNDNGINVDDAERVTDDEAARYLVFRDLDIHDAGRQPSGVADCLKLSGVNDFVVTDSQFARCGTGASGSVGIGGVGAHRGTVHGNTFADNGFGGVQFKGGATDIEIVANRFAAVGFRAANLGGSTGRRFFRPPPTLSAPNAEASRIRMTANVVTGGEAAAAFAGCVDCAFVRNTVVDPTRWLLRILQETVALDTYPVAPTSKGTIADNLFYFRRSDVSAGEDINVGDNTQSESFTLSGNVWFAHDEPRRSQPILPTYKGPRTEQIVGVEPTFVNAAAGDFRVPEGAAGFPPGAPASCEVGAGSAPD